MLARDPIFGKISEQHRTQVASQALLRRYSRGGALCYYGDVWPYLLMVREGLVQAVKESREGRRLVVMTLEPSDIFWGMAFFSPQAPMPVTLEVLEDSQIAIWAQEDVTPALLSSSQAVWALCHLMITRMLQVSQIVEGLAFQPVASRLARLVLDRFGESTERPVSRDLTLDEMAALVGTTREVVCRLLYQFSDDDLIKITRTEFMVTDREGLAGLAEQG